MTRQPLPDPSELQVFALSMELRCGLSRGDHRRFYGQMQRAMHGMDLMLCSFRGLCLLVQVGRQPAYDYRPAVLGWLIVQQEPERLAVHALQPARSFLDDDTPIYPMDNAPLASPLTDRVRKFCQQMLSSLLQRRQAMRATLGLQELPGL